MIWSGEFFSSSPGWWPRPGLVGGTLAAFTVRAIGSLELIVDKIASYISGLNPGWGIVIFIGLLFAASFMARFRNSRAWRSISGQNTDDSHSDQQHGGDHPQ